MIVIAAVSCLLISLGIQRGLAMASDESSVNADVTVVSPANESYGALVIDARETLLAWLALGAPDYLFATVFRNGGMEIELEAAVPDAAVISIWGSNVGFQHSNVKVSVSENEKRWQKIASLKIQSVENRRYDIYGSFGNVRYIKVERSGTPFSFLMLDAVRAKVGD